jgi:hypothetical protein
MAVHQVPSLTQDRYEEVVRRLTGKDRLESPSDLPFDRLFIHVAGRGKNGFCIVDVFESEEAVERFNEAMGSIPKEVGIEEPRRSSFRRTVHRGMTLEVLTRCSASRMTGLALVSRLGWPSLSSVFRGRGEFAIGEQKSRRATQHVASKHGDAYPSCLQCE